jgi:hypothetical protein
LLSDPFRGERLRITMAVYGRKPTEVANELGIHRTRVFDWLNGQHIELDTYRRLILAITGAAESGATH